VDSTDCRLFVEPANSPVVNKITKSVHRCSKRASATTTKTNEKKISVEFDTCRKRATNLSLFCSASFLGGGRLGLPLLSSFGSFSYSGQITKTFFFRKGKINLTKEKGKKAKEGGGRVKGNQHPPVYHLLDERPL
jgi:hypothetical protein